jgi:uroporphyrinogen decarboxylase
LSAYRARRFATAGVDVIHIGDDIGMQDRMLMSPAAWRQWLKPRLARVIAAAREVKPDVVFFYHSDGFIEPVIAELSEIGVDALNPVQPECMDPAAIKRQYGDRLAFWGTVGIQHTLPFGTPEQVAAEVKLRIDTVGKGGGLYLSPTHVIAPEVPYENLFAFVRAAQEYGRYE